MTTSGQVISGAGSPRIVVEGVEHVEGDQHLVVRLADVFELVRVAQPQRPDVLAVRHGDHVLLQPVDRADHAVE